MPASTYPGFPPRLSATIAELDYRLDGWIQNRRIIGPEAARHYLDHRAGQAYYDRARIIRSYVRVAREKGWLADFLPALREEFKMARLGRAVVVFPGTSDRVN